QAKCATAEVSVTGPFLSGGCQESEKTEPTTAAAQKMGPTGVHKRLPVVNWRAIQSSVISSRLLGNDQGGCAGLGGGGGRGGGGDRGFRGGSARDASFEPSPDTVDRGIGPAQSEVGVEDGAAGRGLA